MYVVLSAVQDTWALKNLKGEGYKATCGGHTLLCRLGRIVYQQKQKSQSNDARAVIYGWLTQQNYCSGQRKPY